MSKQKTILDFIKSSARAYTLAVSIHGWLHLLTVLRKVQLKPDTDNMGSLRSNAHTPQGPRLHKQRVMSQTDFAAHALVAGQVTLKRKHAYYYQVQGQMAIANNYGVIFAFGITVERINRPKFLAAENVPQIANILFQVYCTLCGRIKAKNCAV